MKVRKARDRAHALVKQTGNEYAYEFVKVPLVGLVEVRVFKGDRTTYTRVDSSGAPIGRAHGGLPSLSRADPRLVLAATCALGFLADLILR